MTSVEARDELARVLKDDLVGPEPGEPHEEETLEVYPSRFHLTGFLIPLSMKAKELGAESGDEPDVVQKLSGGDDEQPPERAASRRAQFPSSIGLTVLVPKDATAVQVQASWGEYKAHPIEEGPPKGEEAEGAGPALHASRMHWQRVQRVVPAVCDLDRARAAAEARSARRTRRRLLTVSARPVSALVSRTPGTRCVSIFLVNAKAEAEDAKPDEAYLFQAGLACPSRRASSRA